MAPQRRNKSHLYSVTFQLQFVQTCPHWFLLSSCVDVPLELFQGWSCWTRFCRPSISSARLLRVYALLSGLGSAQKRTVQLWCVLVVLALTCHRRLGLCLPEPEMLCNISLMAMEQAAEQQLEDGNRNKAMRKLMASICNR